MTMQPGFLARLGLAEDADERQVRRAYARELKQIDQERDLEGFQYLRACYEAALAWAAERAASAAAVPAEATAEVEGGPAADAGAAPMAQGDAHPAPQALEGVEQVHPGVLGDGVFADFRVRMAELATQPERMGREEAARVAPWTEALRAALADPRLLHLYARVIFEHHVAALLAEGWRPGHHLLLPAAVETFGWDLDRSALARLGHAGALLDDALDQRAMFQSQDILARTQQRELLHLLREGRQPDEDTVRAYAASVASVTYYFPTLLGIVAPHDLAAAWRAQVTDDMLRVAVPVEEDGRKRPWWKGGASPRLCRSAIRSSTCSPPSVSRMALSTRPSIRSASSSCSASRQATSTRRPTWPTRPVGHASSRATRFPRSSRRAGSSAARWARRLSSRSSRRGPRCRRGCC